MSGRIYPQHDTEIFCPDCLMVLDRSDRYGVVYFSEYKCNFCHKLILKSDAISLSSVRIKKIDYLLGFIDIS